MHTRSYLLVRAVARIATYTMMVTAFVALTSEWHF